SMEDWRSIQAEAVLMAGGGHYRLTSRSRRGLVRPPAHRKFGPPKVGDDPTARQVVAEVAERCGGTIGASVNGVAIAAEPPIVPEGRGGHARHRKAGREPIAHGTARRRRKNAVHLLRRRDVCLEVTDDTLQRKTAGVDGILACEEEVLAKHEGDSRKELHPH